MLPNDFDLNYTLRMVLYDRLKSYMDERGRGDFIVIVHEKEYYYKVHLESLGGDSYDTPSLFVDSCLDMYTKIEGSSLELEYEIDDS